jgi:hypothetical protein
VLPDRASGLGLDRRSAIDAGAVQPTGSKTTSLDRSILTT